MIFKIGDLKSGVIALTADLLSTGCRSAPQRGRRGGRLRPVSRTWSRPNTLKAASVACIRIKEDVDADEPSGVLPGRLRARGSQPRRHEVFATAKLFIPTHGREARSQRTTAGRRFLLMALRRPWTRTPRRPEPRAEPAAADDGIVAAIFADGARGARRRACRRRRRRAVVGAGGTARTAAGQPRPRTRSEMACRGRAGRPGTASR